MERKRYDLIPGGLVRDNYPSNSESQEVSRGRSSEEISVMEMERRTEQIYQLLKLGLIPLCVSVRDSTNTLGSPKEECRGSEHNG